MRTVVLAAKKLFAGSRDARVKIEAITSFSKAEVVLDHPLRTALNSWSKTRKDPSERSLSIAWASRRISGPPISKVRAGTIPNSS